LQSSRDAFLQAAAFNWGQARFRVRGLDSEHATMMINGVVMNKIYDGRPQWGEWGGLNDALRNGIHTRNCASDYTFGVFRNTRNQTFESIDLAPEFHFQAPIPITVGVLWPHMPLE
jgi:hypothetical protein